MDNLLGRLPGSRRKGRNPFKVSTKKKEWNKAAGRAETEFKTTSKCRNCKCHLIWRGGAYDFDHKDNNNANNSQRNCYLVCKVCHGKHTKIGKKRVYFMGMPAGHKTIKKKVGYKKSTLSKRKPRPKRKSNPNSFDMPDIRLPKGWP